MTLGCSWSLLSDTCQTGLPSPPSVSPTSSQTQFPYLGSQEAREIRGGSRGRWRTQQLPGFPQRPQHSLGGRGELSRGFISVNPRAPGLGGRAIRDTRWLLSPLKVRTAYWAGRKPVSPVPGPSQQLGRPRVSHLCISPARPCGAEDAFAFADICSRPSRAELGAPSLSQEAAGGEPASQTGRNEDPRRSRHPGSGFSRVGAPLSFLHIAFRQAPVSTQRMNEVLRSRVHLPEFARGVSVGCSSPGGKEGRVKKCLFSLSEPQMSSGPRRAAWALTCLLFPPGPCSWLQ